MEKEDWNTKTESSETLPSLALYTRRETDKATAKAKKKKEEEDVQGVKLQEEREGGRDDKVETKGGKSHTGSPPIFLALFFFSLSFFVDGRVSF